MKIEIITIGDELLLGQVKDLNSTWMAEQCTNELGIKPHWFVTVGDNANDIIQTVKISLERSDIIFVSGGLGPTNDDITKITLAKIFNSNFVLNEDVYNDIKRFFDSRGIEFSKENINAGQAQVPHNCKVILNKAGTAPGMLFEQNGKILISMPGVPFEMKEMFTSFVIPYIEKRYNYTKLYYKTVLTQGLGESFLAEKIKDWENNLPANVSLAYLPSLSEVKLRLTYIGGESLDNEILVINQEIEKLKHIIGDLIYSYDNDTLESLIGNLLKQNKKTMATIESCTGGYISHLITSIPGSSEYFKGSIIPYSNEMKNKILNIDNDLLNKYGAVSKETVSEMLVNGAKILNADYALAVSGIAGPTGSVENKPVGTTYIGVISKVSNTTIVQRFLFGDDRQRNIIRTSKTALNMLRRLIINDQL